MSRLNLNIDFVLETTQNPDLAEAFRDWRQVVLDSIDQNFLTASGPDGATWPPRAHAGDGHPLLIETGSLRIAATGRGPGHVTFWHPLEFSIGIDKNVQLGGIPGAAVHNFGYPPFNIPQREYLAPTEGALDVCEQIIADAVSGQLGI